MPRKMTAYACDFRCGRKTDTNRRRMEAHEKRCKKNPDRRACPSCAHWVQDWDSYYDRHAPGGEVSFKIWYCGIEMNPNPSKGSRDNPENISPFVYECEHWENQPSVKESLTVRGGKNET